MSGDSLQGVPGATEIKSRTMSQDVAVGPDTGARLGYRPALDGLRGIAVLLVFFYHGNWLGVDSGWIGVDLFFVISGFLITRLLVEEYQSTGRIDIRAFLLRRALRLFPALFTLLAVMAVLNILIDIPRTGQGFVPGLWSALLYVRNFYEILNGPTGDPLSHLWSLSIEEQFYLVWPFVVFALMKRSGRNGVAVAATVALGVAAAITSTRWALGTDINTLYFGTIAHGAVAILAGATLGARPRILAAIDRGAAQRLVLVGAGGVITLSLIEDLDPAHVTTGFLLISVVGLLAVAGAASTPTERTRFTVLMRPLIALGKISYGFYLWHLPVILIVLPQLPETNAAVRMGTAAVVSLAVTLLSYFAIEKPALRLKARISPPR